MVGVGQRRDKIREQSRHLQHSIVSARTTDLRQRGKDNTMAERIFFTEGGGTGKKGVESENKRLQSCGNTTSWSRCWLGSQKSWDEGAWGPPPWNLCRRTLACIRKVSPALEGSRKGWLSTVFSASDEALLAALSLWYPGVMQNNQNVSRLISGNQGFWSKQTKLKDKYLLALSGLI